MATITVLDFPTVTDVESSDILYLIRGVGTTRDKKIAIDSLFDTIICYNDGTAALPTRTFDGDPNTGGWHPAADTLAWSTAGVEALRINSTGNVSIKNSSLENWKTILSVLQLGGNGFLETQTTQQAGNYMTIGCNSYWDQTDDRWEYISTDEASAYWQGNGTHSFNIAVSGTADTAITWIEALLINNAGNVGIKNTSVPAWGSGFTGLSIGLSGNVAGTTASLGSFHTVSNAYFDGTNWKYQSNGLASQHMQSGGIHTFYVAISGTAGNNVTWIDALRIDNAGKISTGGETAPDCYAGGITLKFPSSVSNLFMTFKNPGLTHPYTAAAEADTGAEFYGTSTGTFSINTFAVTTTSFAASAFVTSASSSTSTSAPGCIQLAAQESNGGTGAQAIGSTENIMVIRNLSTTVAIFKGNGDIYTDTDQTAGLAGTYDSENDIMLANAARYEIKGYKNHNLKKYSKRLQELGIMENSFISHQKIMDLNLGAIGQMWNVFKHLAKKMNISESELLEMAKNYN
jgi:hypothetical protein